MLKEEMESYSSAKALMEAPVVGTQAFVYHVNHRI